MSDDSVHDRPWIVIVNRAAAAGRVRRRWDGVQRAIERYIPNHEVHFTEYPQHAIELAEELASDGHRRFISVGGDGTTHEILTGVLRAAPPDGSVTLGVVPMGTGGDFKRLLKHQRSLEEAVQAIVQTEARRIDVGRVRYASPEDRTEERYFLNSTSFGLGGLVDKLVNETPKIFGGKASFYLATLRALARYKSTRVRLEIDGEHVGDHDIANVFVTNGRFTGGGMLVAEHSLLNDGAFDITLVPDRGVMWMMTNVGKLYDGTFRQVPGILAWRASHVTAIHLNERMGLLDVDGENPGKLDAVIEVVPLAIRVPNLRDDVLQDEPNAVDDVYDFQFAAQVAERETELVATLPESNTADSVGSAGEATANGHQRPSAEALPASEQSLAPFDVDELGSGGAELDGGLEPFDSGDF